ncbi:hypothetical protein GCM10023329_36230 [Streptomyces sanyensis]|uniref:Uncharacterized protein n=1 Tax=Streptomyces sanyensis TaxID=568869 RepID=A0ABP9ALB4_9ACTN
MGVHVWGLAAPGGRVRAALPSVGREFVMDMSQNSGGTMNGVLTPGHNTVL